MALSPETEAIIKRLKAEGDLIRNTGTNSIKSVNVNLAKFQDVFRSMNENIQALDTVANSDRMVELLERQQEQAALSEEEKAALEQDAGKREMLRNDIANRQLKLQEQELGDREKDRLEKEKSDKRIFGRNGLLSKALGGTFDFIKKAFFIGVAGSLIYEFAAGFLEKQLGIELPTVADGLKSFSTFLKEVNWENLGEQLKILAKSDIGSVIAAFTVGGVAVKGLGVVGDAVTTLSLAKIFQKMITPDTTDVDAVGKKGGRFKFIRGGIAGILFAATASAMPAVEDYVRKSMGMSADDIATREFDAVDIGGNAVISLAGALALGGGPVGWIVGASLFAFKTMHDYLKDAERRSTVPGIIRDVEKARSESESKLEELLRLREIALKFGGNPEKITAEIEALKAEMQKTIQDSRSGIFESLQSKSQNVIEAQQKLDALMQSGVAGMPTTREVPLSFGRGDDLRTETKPLTDSERTGLFSAQLAFLEKELADSQQALDIEVKASQKFADENGFTLYSLGLVQTQYGDVITETMAEHLRAQFEQNEQNKIIAEKQNELINQYNNNLTELDRMIKGEVSTFEEFTRRTLGTGALSTQPMVIAPNTNNYNNYNTTNVRNSSASSNVNGFFGFEDRGSHCTFPGAVN